MVRLDLERLFFYPFSLILRSQPFLRAMNEEIKG